MKTTSFIASNLSILAHIDDGKALVSLEQTRGLKDILSAIGLVNNRGLNLHGAGSVHENGITITSTQTMPSLKTQKSVCCRPLIGTFRGIIWKVDAEPLNTNPDCLRDYFIQTFSSIPKLDASRNQIRLGRAKEDVAGIDENSSRVLSKPAFEAFCRQIATLISCNLKVPKSSDNQRDYKLKLDAVERHSRKICLDNDIKISPLGEDAFLCRLICSTGFSCTKMHQYEEKRFVSYHCSYPKAT